MNQAQAAAASKVLAGLLDDERIGPKVISPPSRDGGSCLTCIGCKYLKSTLLKTGRQPEYEYTCQHPKQTFDHLAYEGYPVETPDHCPERKDWKP